MCEYISFLQKKLIAYFLHIQKTQRSERGQESHERIGREKKNTYLHLYNTLYTISTPKPHGLDPSPIHKLIRLYDPKKFSQVTKHVPSTALCSNIVHKLLRILIIHVKNESNSLRFCTSKTRSNSIASGKIAGMLQDSLGNTHLVQQINGIGGTSGVVFLAFQEKGVLWQF